jgi:hypothetical protein
VNRILLKVSIGSLLSFFGLPGFNLTLFSCCVISLAAMAAKERMKGIDGIGYQRRRRGPDQYNSYSSAFSMCPDFLKWPMAEPKKNFPFAPEPLANCKSREAELKKAG